MPLRNQVYLSPALIQLQNIQNSQYNTATTDLKELQTAVAYSDRCIALMTIPSINEITVNYTLVD